ncbi:hypothetical protein BV898_13336 [Hypsibius exemplaris]|uniref:Lysosome-associated membrane glycoprotein 5 n=1 Tax=Hypsibius exemplaris TaxID=2072580 RepID=A0A1W0WB51_HYPEX|nr:hypothetical protein BV898_13336 [Hypsibius exemplaris]
MNSLSHLTVLLLAFLVASTFATDTANSVSPPPSTPLVIATSKPSESTSKPTESTIVPTTEPATTEPATTKPATTEPATTEPATTEPATTEPATTEPATTEPATTEPATTEPATTVKPTEAPTTQSPVITSTPNPNPAAKWFVKNATTGETCVLATFSADFTVSYNKTDSKTNETSIGMGNVALPKTATANPATSYCTGGTLGTTQRISLDWQVNGFNYSLRVTFDHDKNTVNRTIVSEVRLNYDLADSNTFPGSTVTTETQRSAVTNQTTIAISKGKFLKCDAGLYVLLMTADQGMDVQNLPTTLELTQAKLQAYHEGTSEQFDGDEETCGADLVTTTVSPVVTTPAPSGFGNYTLWSRNGSVCLVAEFDLTVILTYAQKTATNTTVNGDGKVSFGNATVNEHLSDCNDQKSLLVIEDSTKDWQLSLNFSVDTSTSKYAIHSAWLSFSLTNSSEIHDAVDVSNQTAHFTGLNKWGAAVGHAYACSPEETWSSGLTDVHNISKLELQFSKIRVQAFVSANATVFTDIETCPANSPTSDIVPIAVGCALAALVVIVLIAYVIGRRRNRARGYESINALSDTATYVIKTNGTVCLMATFDLGFSIGFETNAGTAATWTNATFSNLNSGTVKVDSVFCNEYQALVIQNFYPNWVLVLQFNETRRPDQSTYQLDFLQLNYTLASFNAANDSRPHYTQNYQVGRFTTPVGQKFTSAYEEFDLTVDRKTSPNVHFVMLHLRNVSIQAFIGSHASSPCVPGTELCRPVNTDYTVVLGVGCGLAGTVALVLVAFVFGRRRFREHIEPDYGTMKS